MPFFLTILVPIFVVTVVLAFIASKKPDPAARRKFIIFASAGLVVFVAFFAGVFFKVNAPTPQDAVNQVTNFEECVKAGNPVMESYPRQCRHGGETFTENIGNELEKTNLIRIDSPRPNDSIDSPLTITGEARGYWFFEATFPVVLVDWDGRIIAEHYAEAHSDWMTEEFVPFEATLEFDSPYSEGDPEFMKNGALILQKSNASGLPEHDDALEIPIRFQ